MFGVPILLPALGGDSADGACTALERWDIGEWANCGGYVIDAQGQLNHRMIVMQHKCHKDAPEPLPLPSQYAETFGKGLQTPSGKIEFVPTTLARAGGSAADIVRTVPPAW